MRLRLAIAAPSGRASRGFARGGRWGRTHRSHRDTSLAFNPLNPSTPISHPSETRTAGASIVYTSKIYGKFFAW